MRKKVSGKKWSDFYIALPFFLILLVYLHNLTRDIYGGDVGDLVTAAWVFGVAHPPGYPTFTLLGLVLSKIPIPLPPVAKIGLISVLSSIGTLILYYNLTKRFVGEKLIILLGVTTLAFSYLFWLYSEIPEVFLFNVFLAFMTLYVAYLFYIGKKERYLWILSFLASFNLSNHHSILLLYPGILILVLKHIRFILNPKRLLVSLIFFGLGFFPFIYVPIAASYNPVMNWDNAVNIQNLLNLFFRVDYGTFSAGNFPKAKTFLEYLIIGKVYLVQIAKAITIPGFLISAIGFYGIYRKDKRLALSLAISFILTGPVFVLYSRFPLVNSFIIGISERFYILSSTLILLLFPSGIKMAKSLLERFVSKKSYAGLIVVVFAIIPVSLFAINFKRTDLSKNTIGNRLGYDVLKTLPKNSLIFVDGDTLVTNTWYVHYVLGYRPDVVVAQLGGFANNYFIDSEFAKFKRKTGSDGTIVDILQDVSKTRRIFYTSQIGYKDVTWVPSGLYSEYLFKGKIPDEKAYVDDQKKLWKKINPPRRADLLISERNLIPSFIPLDYSSALVRTADFIYQKYKNIPDSFYFYKKAQEVDPQYSLSYVNMGIIQFTALGLCQDAERNIQKGIDLALEKKYFLLMYLNYKNCFNDIDKTEQYKQYFKKRFNRDIEKEILAEK